MRKFAALGFALLFCVSAFASGRPDSLTVVSVDQGNRLLVKSATGVWWPEKKSPKQAAKSSVVVWFHGGMTSSNCEKGFVAGDDFAKLFPNVVVVSTSACRDRHWATDAMMAAVDAALDSVAARRGSPVGEVSLVGVSDGALGVLVYSMQGKRRVKDRLLASSFGKLLGEARMLAGANSRMHEGRWRFLQGGNDRLFPAGEARPWIEEFCREVRADCMLRFDPAGEHDWSYWREKHLDWIREAAPSGK
jgi:pimeloyl-ACP methyl ester carboxylesterase